MAPPPPPPDADVEAAAAVAGEDPAMLPSPTTPSSSSSSAPATTTTPITPPHQGRLRRGLKSFGAWATAGVWRNPPATAHLDGLRGMACLTVMVWHFLCGWYPGIAFNDPGAVPPEVSNTLATLDDKALRAESINQSIDPNTHMQMHTQAPYNAHLGVSKLLVFFNGPFSVEIFYALSGFVLCYGYLGSGR